ncbi:PREDICTED: uncharacterized protein LOC105571188 [Vollenhovia emeryi]|uniref:uncharacterized protein LOC105571188 n=1 Tax=Vollenhovia emeryi TaxID=411798 RepID=UPI0005F527B5|nr:PREDICTED: uncharacterized protein LOC105571188 [Vollenhovia emeryi]
MANEQDLATLKRRRAVLQSSCTRIKTFVDSLGAVTVTPSIAAQLEERRVKLNKNMSDYESVQTEIELLDEREENHRINFEDAFYALAAKMRELLRSPAPSVPPPRDTTRSPSSDLDLPRSLAHVRLPKLDLPTFSGKYDEWSPFFDAFQSIIHTNESITAVQKLQYLKGCLKEDASTVIRSLEISALNYEVAWNLLKERYDHKSVIVQTHIRAIMELPCMNKENSAELRQIADGAMRHVHALKALGRPTAHWDDLLIYILSNKLDARTSREWQSSLNTTDLPTLQTFTQFITRQCQMLEATGKITLNSKNNPRSQSSRQTACVATVNSKCGHCHGEHSIYYCKEFLALAIPQRISEMRKRKICVNCLRSTTHASNKCPSGNCKICKSKHNTLLHLAATSSTEHAVSDKENRETSDAASSSNVVATHSLNARSNQGVILSTAITHAYNSTGSLVPCRILLDCGSQANFISKSYLNALGLQPRSLNISITGINDTATQASQMAQVQIKSRVDSFTATVDCIVTDRITDKLPAYTLKRKDFEIPRNIKLADPNFNVSANVDILIGAEMFWSILCVGQIKASVNHPVLQKTRFGWILAGRLNAPSHRSQGIRAFHATISNSQLHEELARFWQLETIGNSRHYTNEESRCEESFLGNFSRDYQGRYIVKLPFKDQPSGRLGDSKDTALKRLYNLEKRFKRYPDLKAQYAHFLHEYLALGHMKQVHDSADSLGESFYLPHHCVFKSTSPSSGIRVVFDASSKTSNGVSLNDILLTGPVIQQDLMSILMRFRTFRYVFVADIVKMYRQIVVEPSHARYQRILWREDQSSEVQTYELATVTYGTTPASYLATRCLKHLAESNRDTYPMGSVCVERDFYVDDLLSGADSLSEAIRARDETISLLRSGCFELSKWASNSPELLKNIHDQNNSTVIINRESDSRILGMHWNQSLDEFHFSYIPDQEHKILSKRVILSEVSRLFDPLGLLGPAVVLSKLLLQDLWHSGIHWDESVSPEISERWKKLKSQFEDFNQLQIPRCVKFSAEPRSIQMHGFCDASQRAFGACVYIRTQIGHENFRCELLVSRSRVAPLKAVSLPRLELSAALLLAQLIDKIKDSFTLSSIQIFLWSDSTIALNWISSSSRKWAVFVANRVGEIQRLTNGNSWRHVSSANNPADVLSRGLHPRELQDSTIWWNGPAFLMTREKLWPNSEFTTLSNDIPESIRTTVHIATVENSVVEDLLTKHSNLNKICRILAYCLRFFKARRSDPLTAFITCSEVSYALNIMYRAVQKTGFPEEYRALIKGETIRTTSNLLSLSPFIDTDGLIRVGGRLKNAQLSFDTCHPILLPRNHTLTRLIILREHERNAHAGLQATMAAVRQRVWPLSLRSVTRKTLQNCVTCFKIKPTSSEAIMGALPAGRITVSRPFHHCGIDYAGPLLIREGKRRNARHSKAYVAVFVCFATKAVHIELVSDLTSDAFIAALKHFVSRRGKPMAIYSDNGTNFVGAQRQLREFYESLSRDSVQTDINNFLRNQGTSWNFIPPNAPHFGGLWEAAVKSAKYHLYRIIGRAHLTFEELQTVLCEVEAILNSRPLTQLSSDPNDLTYLTPGHFLVGTLLNGFPSSDLCDVNENRLVRWQRVEQLRQHFWRRWSTEYLHSLQERHKWKINKGRQLKQDQLVLLKQQGLAPLNWMLGRVEQVHNDSDGNARSATVKTSNGVLVRPLSKISILPIDS